MAGWGGNARIGGDQLFVVEADEYDQAFLTLQPTVAVVNNVEPDHLECYGSLEALENAFVEFAGRASLVLAGADDPGARRVAQRIGARARTFGLAPDADIRIEDVRQAAGGTSARVSFPAGETVTLRLGVPGLHNLRNAVGALAAALHLEPCGAGAGLEALASFNGVGRRFERLGEIQRVQVELMESLGGGKRPPRG